MLRFKRTIAAPLTIAAALALAGCNRERTDLPAFAPATQVVMDDYTMNRANFCGPTRWTIIDPPKVARLAQLTDANRKGWRDGLDSLRMSETGIELHFTGAGVNRTFIVYPDGFYLSPYSTGKGNMASETQGSVPLVNKIPDDAMNQLLADVRAVTKGVEPDAAPTPAATPTASPADKLDARPETGEKAKAANREGKS